MSLSLQQCSATDSCLWIKKVGELIIHLLKLINMSSSHWIWISCKVCHYDMDEEGV